MKPNKYNQTGVNKNNTKPMRENEVTNDEVEEKPYKDSEYAASSSQYEIDISDMPSSGGTLLGSGSGYEVYGFFTDNSDYYKDKYDIYVVCDFGKVLKLPLSADDRAYWNMNLQTKEEYYSYLEKVGGRQFPRYL